MKPIYIVLIVIASLFLLFILVGSFVAYRICFYNPDEKKITDPKYFAKRLVPDEYEPVTKELLAKLEKESFVKVETKSYDGLTLRGNYYIYDKNAPTMIFFHGYRSCLYSDVCGGFQEARRCGFNVLLVSQRSHCFSDGHVITFGIKEQRDVLSWIDFVKKDQGEDTPIALCGVSMGSSTVALASALDLPSNVRCIICDCGYSSVKREIKLNVKQRGLPVFIFYPLVVIGSFLYGHMNLNKGEVTKALKKNKLPIIFFHGEKDQVVPFEMGKENFEAASGFKKFYSFPDATHGISYIFETEKYSEAMSDFLKSVNFDR